jgi:hypothetical protein
MSTYSPSLRIELLGTGEQAGQWGNTTNNNLGTLIESAISGVSTVVVDSNEYVLTARNGTVDESRNALLILTTVAGVNFSVYAPPVTKLYTIYNNSEYTATIYNSTFQGSSEPAGAGVVIPAGKTVVVWSNGTDVSMQLNHLRSLTLSTALAVPYGGTGGTAFTSGAILRGNGTAPIGEATPEDLVDTIGELPVANAEVATKLVTTNFTIEESGGELLFKYGGVAKAKLDSNGNLTTVGNVTAYGTL